MSGEPDTEIKKRTGTLSSILVTITGIIILIIAVITILPEFGVNIATLIAGIGVGGLAIAFAAQNLVRDFISGFFILFEDQYRVGDVVTIAGISGVVEDIGLRRTVLRDLDANVHSVPNGKVEISTNHTKQYSRVNLNISVGYGENLGDSGIDIKILGDTKPAQQWAIKGELRLRLKKTFDSEGIEIPWPHTKIYFGNAPATPGKN
jgi:small-conductance mechanosensitive channel